MTDQLRAGSARVAHGCSAILLPRRPGHPFPETRDASDAVRLLAAAFAVALDGELRARGRDVRDGRLARVRVWPAWVDANSLVRPRRAPPANLRHAEAAGTGGSALPVQIDLDWTVAPDAVDRAAATAAARDFASGGPHRVEHLVAEDPR